VRGAPAPSILSAPSAVWRLVAIVLLLAVQVASPSEARAASPARREILSEDLDKLCRGEGASREQALIDQRQDACLGYIKGVADVLQSSGAVGTCAINQAIGEVFAALSDGRAGYDLEDRGSASRLVARLFIASCRGGMRP
jgi:hypothetical protein